MNEYGALRQKQKPTSSEKNLPFRHYVLHKSHTDWPGKETPGSTRIKALSEAKLKWWNDTEE
jgi:hypothetical protein